MKSLPYTLALVALGSTIAAPTPALACGGLFCSNSNPVNQVAERIVFSRNDDETVTSIIEIQYEGPAHEFAWLLPVPHGKVDFDVSSKQALDALQQASNPVFTLQVDSSCNARVVPIGAVFATADGTTKSDAGEQLVTIAAAGTAGPYDYVQLEVSAAASDPAEVALAWLEDNDYDVPRTGPDVLRPYLESGMDLLAVRLSKGNDAGAVRPVFLTYSGREPSIPIRPTAVAATEDMGILVWVLGDGRAIPKNYLHLELNEARIDWFNPQGTYNAVVTEAADEAGGQGFVTEQAGPAKDFADALYPDWLDTEWDTLRADSSPDLPALFDRLSWVLAAPTALSFSGGLSIQTTTEFYDGYLEVLSDTDIVQLRDGVSPEEFISCSYCYFEQQVDGAFATPYILGEDPLDELDVDAFFAALEKHVIGPLQKTRALFDSQEMVTRLYTTLSADEMDVDPSFDFNEDLGPVSNQHVAIQKTSCDDDWSIELPQGTKVTGTGRTWPVGEDANMAANFIVAQLGTRGAGVILEDNSAAIVAELRSSGAGDVVKNTPTTTTSSGNEVALPPARDRGGCSVVSNPTRSATGGTWALLIGAAAWTARRRRAATPSRAQAG